MNYNGNEWGSVLSVLIFSFMGAFSSYVAER